jgi:hypothetical protein
MATFDFISDSELRQIVESDFDELELCMAHGASKAAMVLSGSIVESVLCDYLASVSPKDKKTILAATLDALIARALEAKVISAETADLSSVIKGYRNLVHPGRLARRAEAEVSTEKAQIAVAVTTMIIKAVAETRTRTMGLTADQLIKKVLTDASAMTIIGHLARQMEPQELDLLVESRLRDVYLERLYEGPSPWDSDTERAARVFRSEQLRLSVCYQQAFSLCSERSRQGAVASLLKIIATEPNPTAVAAEDAFVFPEAWSQLQPADERLLIDHLIGRLGGTGTQPSSTALEALAKHLSIKRERGFAGLVWRALFGGNAPLAASLAQVYANLPNAEAEEMDTVISAAKAEIMEIRANEENRAQVETDLDNLIDEIKYGADIPF